MKNRRHFLAAAALLAGLGVAAPAFAQSSAPKTLKVGTISGPDAQIWEVVARVAKSKGLTLKIVEFGDYQQPNAALDAGDLDANGFQHRPFLDGQIRDRGYKIVSVGQTYVSPMAIYSRKVKALAGLPNGAKVGIPNDASNGSRALLLLQRNGLIKLKNGAGLNGNNASPLDVVENPHKLKLVELDAAQLPRSLADLDAAAINTNYAVEAGLAPTRDAVAMEDLHGPYANLIVVRAKDKNQPWVKPLVASYQSPEVRAYLDKTFKGAILPAF